MWSLGGGDGTAPVRLAPVYESFSVLFLLSRLPRRMGAVRLHQSTSNPQKKSCRQRPAFYLLIYDLVNYFGKLAGNTRFMSSNNRNLNESKTMKTATATALKQINDIVTAMPTARLIQMATMLNTKTDDYSMIVQNAIERQLEGRMSESDFVALMGKFEAELS